MKVMHSTGVSNFSGKSANDVFLYSSVPGMSYLRAYQYPKITEQNTLMGASMANLATIWAQCTALFIADMEAYAVEYHALPMYGVPRAERAYSPFALWVKFVYGVKAKDPTHIDIPTLTLEDIALLQPAAINVAGMVTQGFLPATPNSATYVAQFIT